ncbi:MAG: cysteine synthase family protein [Actinomycetota bacterium]|nr:cysteine synthase family protein [Actinomycetota bacterium]
MEELSDSYLENAIGGTPLVPLRNLTSATTGQVWLKLESGNPTGSYKDRMAYAVIKNAFTRGDINRGSRLVEYTGGSTGTSLAHIAARTGINFIAVSSDAFAQSKIDSMLAYGAEVIIIPSEERKITPDLIAAMREKAYAIAEEPDTHYADQFGSPDVIEGYVPMGQEIADQIDGPVDVFCAAVGTSGAFTGTAKGLHQTGHQPDLIALEPLQSPFLTTGEGGSHRIEGIGLGFTPPFLDLDQCSEIRAIDENDAFLMCRRLATEEGILCGPSTGLNVSAALAIASERGPDSVVVTLGCDHGSKYF